MTPRVPPFKSLEVIGTDTDRSATYDFLLTSRSNNEPISYRFDTNGDFSRKSHFSHPRVFDTLAEWIALGIGYRRLMSKTRVMALPGRERSLTMLSAVWM